MALITCPECGRERVSDSASACPDCGFNIKEFFEKKNDNSAPVKAPVTINTYTCNKCGTKISFLSTEQEPIACKNCGMTFSNNFLDNCNHNSINENKDINWLVNEHERIYNEYSGDERWLKLEEFADKYQFDQTYNILAVHYSDDKEDLYKAKELYKKGINSTQTNIEIRKKLYFNYAYCLKRLIVEKSEYTYHNELINMCKETVKIGNYSGYFLLAQIYTLNLPPFTRDSDLVINYYEKYLENSTVGESNYATAINSLGVEYGDKKKNYIKAYGLCITAYNLKGLELYKKNADNFMKHLTNSVSFKERHIPEKVKNLFALSNSYKNYTTIYQSLIGLNNSDTPVRCPRCGSTQITTTARGVNHFWGGIGASQTVNRCAKCGNTWKPSI